VIYLFIYLFSKPYLDVVEGACGDLGHGFDVGWVVWRRYHATRKVVEVRVLEVRLYITEDTIYIYIREHILYR
jgi:hypothetical protein